MRRIRDQVCGDDVGISRYMSDLLPTDGRYPAAAAGILATGFQQDVKSHKHSCHIRADNEVLMSVVINIAD